MANTESGWGNIFLAFGVLAIIAGIYFLFQKDYQGAIACSIIGALLIYPNMNSINDKNGE